MTIFGFPNAMYSQNHVLISCIVTVACREGISDTNINPQRIRRNFLNQLRTMQLNQWKLNGYEQCNSEAFG